jgi:DNA-binding response OmpR family regulator
MINLAALAPLATTSLAGTPVSGRRSVLIIDYNPPIRDLLCLALLQAGYCAAAVAGGPAALAWIEDALREGLSPALILLDLSVPWVRRVEILHQVRAQWDRTGGSVPRMLILTTYSTDLRELEGFRVIKKPFHLGDLLHEVQSVLSLPLQPGRW